MLKVVFCKGTIDNEVEEEVGPPAERKTESEDGEEYYKKHRTKHNKFVSIRIRQYTSRERHILMHVIMIRRE